MGVKLKTYENEIALSLVFYFISFFLQLMHIFLQKFKDM